MEFKIALDVFAGPMDLLLYLVKRHEVDVTQVPIAKIAEDFVAYLDLLEDLAIEQVGEFVEMASLLLEIKARELVPRPEETEPPVEPIREALVARLLEYKQYRDAAVLLEDRAREWELRFPRIAVDEQPRAPVEVTIGDVHVGDLVGALARVMRKREKRRPREIIQDDTPIETHIERVEALVTERGRVAFSELIDADMPRTRMVGILLAILELVRRGRIAARQDRIFDEIWLEPSRSATAPPADGPVATRGPSGDTA
ncbi:MAG: segregation and condensation protein A [Planctomycetia bacterium]